jgi:uncharacterized protein (TIGR02466 family)
MAYTKHQMFPIPFYEFDFSDHIEKVLQLIPKESSNVNPWYPTITQTDNQILHTLDHWKFLKDNIEDCLLNIQTDEGYDSGFGRLKLTRLWANIVTKESTGNQAQHRHPMSYYSGIFYLTEGAPTTFIDPCYARSLSAIEIPNDHMYNSFNIEPKPGLVIIFPSYVQHLTLPHTDNYDRITMAFNCLPEHMVPA